MPDNPQASPTFCILPWTHLATNASGQLRYCCNVQPGVGLVRDEHGRAVTLAGGVNLDEVWNAPSYRAIRREMLDGRWPAACARCRIEEAAGVKSARQGWNEAYAEDVAEALAATDAEGRAPLKIRYVDLRLGNLCNLKCRMCNPYASVRWLEDWETVGATLAEGERERLAKLDWFNDPGAWTSLERSLAHCDLIYFTGGEPLLIDEHQKFLRFCTERGFASRLTLKYNTNLTLLPPELIELWRPFRKVRLNCSLDAVGALNTYIRYPSRWPVVSRNIAKLNELARGPEGRRLRLTFHVTVQAYNFPRLTEILDFVREQPGFTPLPYLNILDRPRHLSIRQLPPALKHASIARLDEWRERHAAFLADVDPAYAAKLAGLGAFALAEETDPASLRDLKRFTDTLDAARGQKLSELVPELAEWL